MMMKLIVISLLLSVALHLRVSSGMMIKSCPSVNDPCMNDENHAQCKLLEGDEMCLEIVVNEMCPFDFHCIVANNTTNIITNENDEPRVEARSLAVFECPRPGGECKCPRGGKNCSTMKSYRQCKKLYKNGCKSVGVRNCPFTYYCKKI